MKDYVLIQARDSNDVYRVNYADLYDSFEVNYQLNANYEVSLTLTYIKDYKDVFNAAKPKAWLWFNEQWYVIQQTESSINDKGYLTLKVTANHILLDKLKNLRTDVPEPTEDNPNTSQSGSGSSSNNDPNKPDVVIKKTDEKQYYSLDDRLHKFFDNNDQGISYELHGNFPNAAVDVDNTSAYEWLGSHLKDYNAYYVPNGNVLKVYDMPSLERQTGRQFRYLNNMTTAELKTEDNNIVNDCQVYGGKMEKDFTSGTGGGGGSLDSKDAFLKSPINADFGVNKQQMISNFAARSQKVQARGVDVNRLYDTVKAAGVSPEWFFAYELQEQNSNMGWLNHWSYPHGDPYNDATVVCNWIKQTANSNSFVAATESGKGNQSLAAQWNATYGKGTIGRVYLQATAAAAWEMEGIAGGYYGQPIAGCMNVIRSWGGHTNSGSTGGGWGWPFPSVGEGNFTLGQTFGTHPQDGVGRTNGFHDGLDFGSIDHPGSEVHAVHGGKVTISRAYGSGVGYYVVIQDSTGLNVEYQEAFGSPNDIYVNVGDTVQLGQVIGRRTTNHLHLGITRHSFPEAFRHAFNDDGTWLDPRSTIKSGIVPGGDSGSTATTTTSQTYYSLHYHYEDQDSIKRFGRHRGKNIVMDSIYDMDTLKKCVEATVQHLPPTTLTIKDIFEDDFNIGDVWRVIVPEMTVNYDVTLMGIKYNPFNKKNKNADLSFNNTGLVMRNVINSIYSDIHQMNANVNQLDTFATIGGRQEDQFNNIGNQTEHKFSKNDSDTIKNFVNS